MTLEQFNSKYKYKKDSEKFYLPEVWEVIEPDKYGIYYGDCESYALSLQEYVEGFQDWEIYGCKLNGEGHVVLYKDGMVIDNNVKKVISVEAYGTLYAVTMLKKYNPILKFIKILYGKVFKYLKRK